jgi:WD40 repeat protein
VAFSPDGKQVVSGSLDETIRVWDAEMGVIVSGPFEGHSDSVTSVAFSPDGKRVVSGSDDKTIRVCDAEAGMIISGPFDGHSNLVTSVAFSPDGKQVVSGSSDCTIQDTEIDFSDCEVPDSLVSYEFTRSQVAVKNGFRDDSVLMRNGWMVNSSSTLLFWVPPWNRNGLWWPRNTALIGQDSTKLNLSSFIHGTSWAQCIQDT